MLLIEFGYAEIAMTVQKSEKCKREPSDNDPSDEAYGAAFEHVQSRYE